MSLRADVGLGRGPLELETRLEVEDGTVLALIGPNGAGKTTLLRALAGLEAIDRGEVVIDGEVMDAPASACFVQPEHRPVGMVFQDHLLFPHLDLLDNVAFGLRARGVSRDRARHRAAEWLDAVGLSGLASSRPGEVSGGQAQRAAIARALATGPRLLLLDEPLSALDASARPAMRRDLRRRLAGFGGASVLVSHDPLDALALADSVAVLEAGRITQQGTVAEVADRPRTPYVAELLGVNLLRGTARGTVVELEGSSAVVTLADPATGPTLLLVRPRTVSVHRGRPDTSARNVWPCTVEALDLLGEHVRVRLGGDPRLVAEVTPAAVAALGLAEGEPVWASVKATEVVAYPA